MFDLKNKVKCHMLDAASRHVARPKRYFHIFLGLGYIHEEIDSFSS